MNIEGQTPGGIYQRASNICQIFFLNRVYQPQNIFKAVISYCETNEKL
jgi:hypothetical protein